MSNNCGTGKGGSIIPSARPSIHRHRNCQFASTPAIPVFGMGTYGKNKSPRNKDPQTSHASNTEQSIDEVDNIQSKYALPSSPLAARRKDQGRNSYDYVSPPCLDDTSDDDDSDTDRRRDRQQRVIQHNLESSNNDTSASQSFNDSSFSGRLRNESVNRERSTTISPENGHQPKSQNGILLTFAAVLIFIVSAYFGRDTLNSVQGSTSKKYDEITFHNDLNDLGRKYTISDDSILRVQTGISTISKRQDTGSFVFVYNSNTDYFDSVGFNDLIDAIALKSARYLRNNSETVQHIVVHGSMLDVRSDSDLINKYKDDVARTGVMLVRELHRVPSALAMAFHYYCDEYNPLVKKSAIFFTLDMAKCSSSSAKQQYTHAQIEKCLMQKWSGVPEDNIRPLLTRVVNSVIDVAS